jgi:hypothetical protein
MKRNILHGALVAGLSAAALSSCIENNGNQISLGNVASTVVRSEYGQTVVQDDYTHYYYYADEFEGQGFQMGDRVLLSSWTIDYDNQPSNAYGTVNSPLKATKVEFEQIETKWYINGSNAEVDALSNDSVSIFAAPYITTSTISETYGSLTYLTFTGTTYKGASPKFNLIYTGTLPSVSESVPDTLVYDFKCSFTSDNYTKNTTEVYVKSFRMPTFKDNQPILINYCGIYTQLSTDEAWGNGYVVLTASSN